MKGVERNGGRKKWRGEGNERIRFGKDWRERWKRRIKVMSIRLCGETK